MDDPGDFLFSAKDLQKWRWRVSGAPRIEPPEAAIFCLQPELLQRARRRYALKPVRGLVGQAFRYKHKTGGVILAGGIGLGAPAMAILVEEYAAFGACRFLSIGVAGSLRSDLSPGDIIVCDRAMRGEGTSRHYLPPSACVDADRSLTQALGSLLSAHNICSYSGDSWTTDAPFRESFQEADHHREQGVLCVDMETAALFSVSQSLHLQAAAVLVVADRLGQNGWEPPQTMRPVQDGLMRILEVAVPWLAGEVT